MFRRWRERRRQKRREEAERTHQWLYGESWGDFFERAISRRHSAQEEGELARRQMSEQMERRLDERLKKEEEEER